MDKKIIAIALVAIIIVAGVAVVLLTGGSGGKDSGLSIVGRVNSEGSGLILAPGENPEDYITETKEMPGFGAKFIYNESNKTYYVFHPEAWGGKVFATPGLATIQHVQLMELVVEIMGLKFVSYTDTTVPAKDTVYHVAGVSSFADFENKRQTTPAIIGYIIWEAQYSVGLVKGYESLALTNDLFDGHTCCIIGTSNKYLEKNPDVAKAFLAVYCKAVDAVNYACEHTDSTEYTNLIEIASKRVAMPDSLTDAQKRHTIALALENVTYLYSDYPNGSLTHLTEDISALAESLYTAEQIEKSAKDLGFDSYDDLAKAFVKDSYLKDALKGSYTKLTQKTKINVAAIAGDIHQIAIWYAIDTKMFEEANLEIVIMGQGGGPAVFNLLMNGEADFGFLGAPPMTIRSMNAEQIHA